MYIYPVPFDRADIHARNCDGLFLLLRNTMYYVFYQLYVYI